MARNRHSYGKQTPPGSSSSEDCRTCPAPWSTRYRKTLVDREFCDNMVYETTRDAQGGSNHMNERIVIDPRICHGKPVIRGTRMPVALVVGSLAGGMSFEEVQREYDLTIDDIRAALKFAGELVEQEQHHPLPG